MKPFVTGRSTESSGILKTVDYHIDQDNIAHIVQILRNMYSDPILAVIREYAANATDAHVEAGIADQPIEVTLPTIMNPTLTIRDFGKGLSEEDVYKLLCGYGASGAAKRSGATADKQIGGFGIGCKSAYAISDQFAYTVWHNGQKQLWTCFLDENDIGKAALTHVEPSEGVSGVEVAIPVATSSIRKVAEAAIKAFQWYAVQPKITGMPHDLHVLPQPKVILDGFILGGAVRWCFTEAQQDSCVVMGGVSYPLKWGSVDPKFDTYPMSTKFPYCRLVLHAPIGYFAMAPNREELRYSAKVIKDLRTVEDAIVKGVAATVAAELNKQAEGWPRCVRAAEVVTGYTDKIADELKPFFDQSNFGVHPVYFKGTVDEVTLYQVLAPMTWSRRSKLSLNSFSGGISTGRQYFQPKIGTRFGWVVGNDVTTTSQRLEYARQQNKLPANEQYAFIFFGPLSARTKLEAKIPWLVNAPVDDIVALYDKPPKGTFTRTSGITRANKALADGSMFKLRGSALDPRHTAIGSQWWDSVPKPNDVLKTKPVVVIVNGHRVLSEPSKLSHVQMIKGVTAPWLFVSQFDRLITTLKLTAPTIYGLREQAWLKAGFDQSQVTLFSDWVQKQLTDILDSGNPYTWKQLAAVTADAGYGSKMHTVPPGTGLWRLIPKYNELAKHSLLRPYLEALVPYEPTNAAIQTDWSNVVGAWLLPADKSKLEQHEKEFKKLVLSVSVKSITSAYPLLRTDRTWNNSDSLLDIPIVDAKEWLLYINAKDEERKNKKP